MQLHSHLIVLLRSLVKALSFDPAGEEATPTVPGHQNLQTPYHKNLGAQRSAAVGSLSLDKPELRQGWGERVTKFGGLFINLMD